MKKHLRLLSLLLCCVMLFGSCTSSKAIMTYKDSSITSNMYSYWLSTYKASFLSSFNSSGDSEEFWNTVITDDQTAAEYATELINKQIKYILVGVQLFNEYGLKMDSDVLSAIDEDISEKSEYAGGHSALNSALSEYGINEDILRECYIAEEKLNAVYDYLYGDDGIEAMTDEMIDEYYEENYSRVRYIVIYTTDKFVYDEEGNITYDSDGYPITEEMTDEEKAEKQEKISHAMIEINAGETFDNVSELYNEVDMSYYEHGFYVSANELSTFGYKMVSEVQGMDVGDIRKIEDTDATYIVEKLSLLDRDDFTSPDEEQLEYLEEYCIQQYYNEKFSSLAEEITVNEDELNNYSILTASPNSYY